jgi:hypothetical protein
MASAGVAEDLHAPNSALAKLRTPAVLLTHNGSSLAIPNYMAAEVENSRVNISARMSSLSRRTSYASPGAVDDDDAGDAAAQRCGSPHRSFTARSAQSLCGGHGASQTTSPRTNSRSGADALAALAQRNISVSGSCSRGASPMRRPSAADGLHLDAGLAGSSFSLSAGASQRLRVLAPAHAQRQQQQHLANSSYSNLSLAVGGRMIQHYDYSADDDDMDDDELETDLAFAQVGDARL